MADVSSNLYQWSTTASSNSPSGSTTIGTGLDDNLREIQKVVRQDLATKGADIASAGTMDLGAVAGLYHDITGTTTVTGLGTVSAGIWKFLKFEGAVPLIHSTAIGLPGASNITTADGDTAIVVSEGSGNWRCLSYVPAALRPTRRIELQTPQTTTSGNSVSVSNIPSGVRRVKVLFNGVGLSGTDNLLVRVGTGGSETTSGYVAGSNGMDAAGGTDGVTSTAGFIVAINSDTVTGVMTIELMNSSSNIWVATHTVKRNGGTVSVAGSGGVTLAGALDIVTVTRTGTDTLDAGSVNVSYEF